MTKPLRETMPLCTGFIDACREVFGADVINAAIKSGMQGQDTFYASENGAVLGVFSPDTGVTLSDMVIGPQQRATQATEANKCK